MPARKGRNTPEVIGGESGHSREEKRDQPEHGFEWDSPRWREEADAQREVERGRRFRDQGAPPQRGAIDDRGSVSRSSRSAATPLSDSSSVSEESTHDE